MLLKTLLWAIISLKMRIESGKKSTINTGHLCQQCLPTTAGEPARGLLQVSPSEAPGIYMLAQSSCGRGGTLPGSWRWRWGVLLLPRGVFSHPVSLGSAASQKVPLSLNVYCTECIRRPEKWYNDGTGGGGGVLRWLTVGLSIKFRGTCIPFDPLQSISVGF